MSSSSPKLSILLSFFILGALACTGEVEPEPSAPDKPAMKAVQAPSVALAPPGKTKASSLASGPQFKGETYAGVKLTCCTNTRVNRVLDRALELHLALVAEKGVEGAMDALALAARDAEKEGALEPSSLASVVAIAQAAEGAHGGELSQQRQAMLQIGRQLELLIPAHAGGARDLAKAKDPATGDIWYQREGRARNPYGGSAAQFTK